jgi:hypothetical protein
VAVPRGARPGNGRRHRAAARPQARGAARRTDLDAARQFDRDREQGGDPQAARRIDRRCRRGDPRLAPARRRAAAAERAAAQPGARIGARRVDRDVRRTTPRCLGRDLNVSGTATSFTAAERSSGLHSSIRQSHTGRNKRQCQIDFGRAASGAQYVVARGMRKCSGQASNAPPGACTH